MKIIYFKKTLLNNTVRYTYLKRNCVNYNKVRLTKLKKKIYKEKFIDSCSPFGQLNIDSEFQFEKDKKELEFLFAPKLSNIKRSVQRSKNKFLDILKCNNFDYFVTLTFGDTNRLNDNFVRNQFRNWCNDIRKKNKNLYYVAVPEFHKKGGLHYHVLIGGCSDKDLKLVDSGHFTKNGEIIYNVNAFRLGFSTATKIKNLEAVRYYISKYLTKTSIDTRFIGKKRYFYSMNIKKPKILRFMFNENDIDIDKFNVEDYFTEDCVLKYSNIEETLKVYQNDKY